jgi:hypothetical protein
MKIGLLVLVGLTLSLGAGPALAFKTVEGCDIVAFASKDSPVQIAPERWQAYRAASEAALGLDWNPPLGVPDPLAALVAAQSELLEGVKQSAAYRDYMAGDSCKLLSTLNASAVDALLAEAVAAIPPKAGEALRQVVATMRGRVEKIRSSARFRSLNDLTLFSARYYCFVAAAIAAFLPPERQREITLEDFGETVSCKDVGRSA